MGYGLCAGVSSVDITPPLGMELAGYPHFPRHNTGAHDPLTAGCLYLYDGRTPTAIVGMDLLFFSKKHIEVIRRRVEAKTGIPGRNIMFCCSHTHSGPWAAGRLDLEALLDGVRQDDAYIEELCDKLTGVIVSASRTAFPCAIGFGTELCGREQNIGGNRRDPKNGPCDPNVYALSVRDASGIVRGLLVNYAVHPTLLHADNSLCSADYPGYLRARLRAHFPQAVTVFGLGASGDQSSRYFRNGQTFDEACRFGEAMGDAAAKSVGCMEYSQDAVLSVKTAVIAPKLRVLPDQATAERHVRGKKEAYDLLVAAGAPYIDIQNANVALLGAEDILGYVLAQKQNIPLELVTDELPAEVMLLSIGDIRIAGMPGEVFTGIAQQVRQRTGAKKLFINTVTNGCLPGYVYTREDSVLGGYEVDTSLLDVSAGYEIADALISLF